MPQPQDTDRQDADRQDTDRGRAVVEAYLAAHGRGDVDAAGRLFADDAVVTDDGRTHRGRREVDAWLRRTSVEYTYTADHTSRPERRDGRWVATRHLEGDFPGGVVDLDHLVTVEGTTVTALTIRPA